MSIPSPPHRIAAVFDLDNTLLPGTSAERLFVRFLIRKRLIGARVAAATLLALLRHMRQGPATVLRTRRPYLRGVEVERLRRLGEEAVSSAIVHRLSRQGVARVREHVRAGHRTAIVSGSLPFLLGPLGRALNVQVVFGTPLDAANDRYTGALSGQHTYGLEKAVVTRRFANDERIELAASYGYADHHTDVYFLELFGHPTCVNPTRRLRSVAHQRHWPTETWSSGDLRR